MKNIVVSLFDVTGKMIQPWLNAGFECYIVDIQHPLALETNGITTVGSLHKVHYDLTKPWVPPFNNEKIAFVSSFPPCDHLAVSGARWFKGKGLRKLATSIEMFATASEFCEWSTAPYFIENPVSNISSHWRKPDHYFSPYYFTGYNIEDNYTKKTCLWVGNGFIMPSIFTVQGLPPPDDRIHKCPPGPDRHNIRSATPSGFAEAVYQTNTPKKFLPGRKFSDTLSSLDH